MYGAILGDIIGSRFEFDRGGKTKDFTLFTPADEFTDDTVMTIAVGEALMKVGRDAPPEQIRQAVIDSMRAWGHAYPHAGYGCRFMDWMFRQNPPTPYNSFGNGSAMRVSAAGWLYDTLERTREAARATAEVTHNHPEGIKGAECTAAVMFLARTGSSKEAIRDYVIREFGYDLTETLEQLRARHAHIETCQDSLPKALTAFFTGESYEDVVRSAVSLGGDTDTLAAIAGAMAEAMYGIPEAILAQGRTYLPADILAVLDAFADTVGGSRTGDRRYEYSPHLKKAIARFAASSTENNFDKMIMMLIGAMMTDGQSPTPMVDTGNVLAALDPEDLTVGSTITLDRDVHLQFDTMTDKDGKLWFPLFSDEEELRKGQTANIIMDVPVRAILENGLHSDRVEGVVINPFGQPLALTKEVLQVLLEQYDRAQICD